MSTYRRMRASDEDREEATALLNDAFVAGQLTYEELDERCTAAFAAKTWGELSDLTADLPVVRMAISPPSGAIAPRDVQQPDNQQPFWPLVAFALVLGAVLASLAASAVAWTAAVLISLTLLLPLILRSASRRRRGRQLHSSGPG